jgi:hypothetical protein
MADPCSGKWIHPAVILVATNLSDLDRLMPFALDQAAQSGARLVLLHAVANTDTMSVDAVGLPYYDPSGALDVAEKALEPWCAIAQNHGVECSAIVREGSAIQQIAAGASIQGRSNCFRDPEQEQARQDASRLRGRTSAALGQPPGHYRGTRGSSPGAERLRGTCRAACHHSQRDLSPERSACLRTSRTTRCQTRSATCFTASRADDPRRRGFGF